MKLFVAAVCLWGCLVLPSMPVRAAQPSSVESLPNWFWGCWIVKKDLYVKDISGLSQKKVDAIIGTRIVFTPLCARWKRTVIRSPKYTVRVPSNDQFFRGRYGTYNNLDAIGVGSNYVTQVTTDLPDGLCDLDFVGQDVYLRKNDIVIEVEGAYMVAKKAKPGDKACACSDAGAGQKERPKK